MLIKTLFDRHRKYDECVPADQMDSANVEYRHGADLAEGLSAAFAVGGLALSFFSSGKWDCGSLDLEKTWINDGDVETRVLSVPHACSANSLGIAR